LLVLLLERLDTRVRTAEALADLLQWPVLTTLWRSYIADRREMVNPGGHDANVEGYRLLRTKLGFAGVDDRLHTLAVTSALAGEGKSIVAANLAIFMARAGKNTLLIDADLRQPVQHELFHLAAEKPGLSNAILAMSMLSAAGSAAHHQFITPGGPGQPSKIAGASSFSPAPFMHDVGIPNLRVMPSGSLPPNPAELLNSKAMQRLLMELSDCGADMVICDTPPVCGLPDTGILASKVDGTLVVVDVSHAQRAPLQAMKAFLVEAGAQVIGCIANKQRNPAYEPSHPCQAERWSATIHPAIEDTVPLAGLPTAADDARNAARLTLPAEATNELPEAQRADVRVAR
jgi:Mrp family chromosome partitioning ATPase